MQEALARCSFLQRHIHELTPVLQVMAEDASSSHRSGFAHICLPISAAAHPSFSSSFLSALGTGKPACFSNSTGTLGSCSRLSCTWKWDRHSTSHPHTSGTTDLAELASVLSTRLTVARRPACEAACRHERLQLKCACTWQACSLSPDLQCVYYALSLCSGLGCKGSAFGCCSD